MSDLSRISGSIVHDLAGMVTNLQAFSGILESSPDHHSRRDFISVLAREARASVQAVKDLQLLAEIGYEGFGSRNEEVFLGDLLEAVSEALGLPYQSSGGTPAVRGNRDLLTSLLIRTSQVAVGIQAAPVLPLEVEPVEGSPRLCLDLSHCVYEGDLEEDLACGRKELRSLALLVAAVEGWGGTSELGPGPVLVLTFPAAPQIPLPRPRT